MSAETRGQIDAVMVFQRGDVFSDSRFVGAVSYPHRTMPGLNVEIGVVVYKRDQNGHRSQGYGQRALAPSLESALEDAPQTVEGGAGQQVDHRNEADGASRRGRFVSNGEDPGLKHDHQPGQKQEMFGLPPAIQGISQAQHEEHGHHEIQQRSIGQVVQGPGVALVVEHEQVLTQVVP